MKAKHLVVGACAVALAAFGLLRMRPAAEAAAPQAPRFEVDPLWPKPLPNHWVIGAVIGVAVDGKDNVWIIHREGSLEPKEKYAASNPRQSECCAPAPAVLQFNQAGDLLASWGGPGQGYTWPASNHGIDVDYKGNVWIGGNGRGQQTKLAADESKMAAAGAVHDSMLLKFTQAGKFLMQIGKPNSSQGSNDTDNLRLPAKSLVDPKTNELYVADGYGNRRVIVYDADSGKYKRHWGAYGSKPDDTRPRSVQAGRASAQAVPHAGAWCRISERRPLVRLRPYQRPHPSLQNRRHLRKRNLHREGYARRRVDIRCRVVAGIRSRSTFTSPTART